MATLIKSDLEFILEQILLSEQHARDTWTTPGTPLAAVIGDPLLSFGLRSAIALMLRHRIPLPSAADCVRCELRRERPVLRSLYNFLTQLPLIRFDARGDCLALTFPRKGNPGVTAAVDIDQSFLGLARFGVNPTLVLLPTIVKNEVALIY